MKHKITLLIFILLAFFQEAYAQTNIFTTPGNWSVGSNWSLGVPPTSANDVIINAPVFITISGAEALSVVNNSAMTIFGAATLTVTNNFNNASSLTIASDATNNGSVIVGTYSGNSATYQRYLTGGGSNWHLLSTPLSTDAETISSFISTYGASMAQDGVKYSLGTYDNSFAADGFSTWMNYTSDLSNPAPATAFPAGVGYEILMNASGTVNFTGDINTAGATVTLTENVTGWNLIGNPFPSSISGNINADANNFLTGNTGLLDPSFVSMYIWNPVGGSYDIINQASGARYLAPGQAFFVKRIPVASFPGSANVLFNINMRIHQTTNNFQKTATSAIPTINLTVDNNAGTVKSTEIKYMSGATLGLDPGYDGGQFGGVGTTNFNLYTDLVQDNGVKFALQVVPDTDYDNTVIPVGINANSGTQITFKATATDLPVGKKVILEDKLVNTFTEINQTDKFYTVTLSSNLSGTGRFFLHTLSNSLSIDEDDVIASKYKLATSAEQQNIRLYGAVTEKGAMNIFDTFGRKIYTTTLQTGTEQDINMPKIATGIYIVKFDIDNRSFSKKIMWH